MEKHNINFTKLVETLRWNGKEYKGSIMDEDDKKLYCDAADALEAADEKIAELERQLLKEGERDATNVNGNQSDEDKTVMDCSYCSSADGCLEAFSKSTLCPRVTGEQMRGEHDE